MEIGDLVFLSNALNPQPRTRKHRKVVRYAYSGIDEVGKNDPIVRRFLTSK